MASDADELRAMAAAMRKEHDRLFNERGWDADVYWSELARAAKEAQLNLGNTGLRIYLVGGVRVTDGTTTQATAADDADRKHEGSAK